MKLREWLAWIGFGISFVTMIFAGVVTESVGEERINLQTAMTVVSEELTEIRRRHDLAIEFGFQPIIVEIVDHHSRAAIATGGDEFRLIQTHEYLTHIFLSLIYAESRGNFSAVGDKGKARGLTQIWTTTAQEYVEDVSAEELLDPGVNIEISFAHFQKLLVDYRGNFTLALLAWNRGAGRVNELIAWGQSPANGYGERVFSASIEASRFSVSVSTLGRGR